MQKELELALENGKAVHVIRIKGDIINITVADSTEELIKGIVDNQEPGDGFEYLTGEEGYLVACNQAIFEYITDYSDSIEMIQDPEPTQAQMYEAHKKFFSTSIEDITKNIKKETFTNGFYDWDKLIVEFNGSDIKHPININEEGSFFEIYVSK